MGGKEGGKEERKGGGGHTYVAPHHLFACGGIAGSFHGLTKHRRVAEDVVQLRVGVEEGAHLGREGGREGRKGRRVEYGDEEKGREGQEGERRSPF